MEFASTCRERRLDGAMTIFLYVASRKNELLPALMIVQGKQYALFGSCGYAWRLYLKMPFGDGNFGDVRSEFSKVMSKVCVSVQW